MVNICGSAISNSALNSLVVSALCRHIWYCFLRKWVGARYGISSNIHHDFSGGLVSSESLEFTSRLNITVFTTAANSPFSNGICERNHSVVNDMISKICTDNPGSLGAKSCNVSLRLTQKVAKV